MEHNVQKCSCPHHKMGGVFVILFALTFLLGNLEVISSHIVGIVWPIIVGLAGFTKIMGGRCKCCNRD